MQGKQHITIAGASLPETAPMSLSAPSSKKGSVTLFGQGCIRVFRRSFNWLMCWLSRLQAAFEVIKRMSVSTVFYKLMDIDVGFWVWGVKG